MKDINLNYLIAKKYTAFFFKNLEKKSKNLDLKAVKEVYKNVKKYDDVSYLKDLFNETNKTEIIKLIKDEKSTFKAEYASVKNELDDFYNSCFLNHEILDIKDIKTRLKNLKTHQNLLIFPLFVNDVDNLITFDTSILNELDVYIMKHKSGEYVEMKGIRDSVLKIINQVK